MSHLSTAADLKQKCQDTGNCLEYQQFVASETDSYYNAMIGEITSALVLGAIFLAIGIVIVVAARNKRIRLMVTKILAAFIVILPFLLIEAVALVAGFAISFSKCFMESCSDFEASMLWMMPVYALVVSVPLTILLAKRLNWLRNKIYAKNTTFYAIGGAIVILTLLAVSGSIATQYQYYQESIGRL